MPSDATSLQTTMRLIVPIGWSTSLTGPDLFSISTGATPNALGPEVMHESPSR